MAYNAKHNEANGEGGEDGESHNRSWNCGVEGSSSDADVVNCRRRQQRNLLTTLLVSQGVPMLLGGDEIGRTQDGNNNAYCQDNETSWYDWDEIDDGLLDFTRRMIALRREHPVLRRRRWFHGRPIRGTSDVGWAKPDGAEMNDEDWDVGFARAVGLFLHGDAIRTPDERGQRVVDDSFLLLFNAHDEPIGWTLPSQWGDKWELVADTAEAAEGPDAAEDAGTIWMGASEGDISVAGRSVQVLRRVSGP